MSAKLNKMKIGKLLICVVVLYLPLAQAEGPIMEAFPPNAKAENFSLFDLSGNKHQLTSFRGKYLLLNFWSMSCNVCKSEMTTLQFALDEIGGEHIEVISIHAGPNIDGAESVLKLNHISYPILVDMDLQLGNWGIPILPTTFLIDPNGNISHRAVGSRQWNSPFMLDFLQAIIKNPDKEASITKGLGLKRTNY